MKQHFLIPLFMFTILISSCGKNKNEKLKYRIVGYIYNSIDSTPFTNTQFKVYSYTYYTAETKEAFFYTDNKGAFDFTSEFAGNLVWPSYFNGAAYTGPPHFGNSKRHETDNDARINISYFDTIYTTPYH